MDNCILVLGSGLKTSAGNPLHLSSSHIKNVPVWVMCCSGNQPDIMVTLFCFFGYIQFPVRIWASTKLKKKKAYIFATIILIAFHTCLYTIRQI